MIRTCCSESVQKIQVSKNGRPLRAPRRSILVHTRANILGSPGTTHITCHDASTSSFIVTSKCIHIVIAPRSLTHHDSISRSRSSARVFADTHTNHEERHNDPRLADCPLDSRHCDSKSICVIALVCVLIVVYAGVCLEAGIERRK